MIIIQTTIDTEKKAEELINLLLQTNKIACGTFHKIQSSYKWK
ncbi:MAG: divalent cation tolerance protein CutA, partial [Actinomycetota bacterium]|nr:divalent cation tolerance protein CutA [Actinomycetota bacterium]